MADKEITSLRRRLSILNKYISENQMLSDEDRTFFIRFQNKIVQILKKKDSDDRDLNFTFIYIMVPNWFRHLFREFTITYLVKKYSDSNLKNMLNTKPKWLSDDVNLKSGTILDIFKTQNIKIEIFNKVEWAKGCDFFCASAKQGEFNRNSIAHSLPTLYRNLSDSNTYDACRENFQALVKFFLAFKRLIKSCPP